LNRTGARSSGRTSPHEALSKDWFLLWNYEKLHFETRTPGRFRSLRDDRRQHPRIASRFWAFGAESLDD